VGVHCPEFRIVTYRPWRVNFGITLFGSFHRGDFRGPNAWVFSLNDYANPFVLSDGVLHEH
jgi:hypothetical protein